MRSRFLAHFQKEEPAQWREGWRLAERLGSAAWPLLTEMAQNEANLRTRLLLVSAQFAAAPAAGEAIVAQLNKGRSAESNEIHLALILMAMGPMQRTGGDRLAEWLQSRKGDNNEATQVAGCLALARCEPRGAIPEAWFRKDDPGVVAAAITAQAPPPDSGQRLRRWLQPVRGEPARQLILSAAFLAEHGLGADDEPRFERALAVLGDAGQPLTLRRAAALCIGRAAGATELLARLPREPEVELLPLLAFPLPGRRAAYDRGWLTPKVSERITRDTRAQTLVLHTLAAPLRAVPASLPWGNDVADAGCLALAWRLLGGSETLPVGPWLESLAAVREQVCLQVALGLNPEILQNSLHDPQLERALRLLGEQRLSPAATAQAVEAALWRRNVHPGASVRALRLQLVASLLVAGSRYASGHESDPTQYFPHGFARDNDPLFSVAYWWWRDALQREELAEYRLRS